MNLNKIVSREKNNSRISFRVIHRSIMLKNNFNISKLLVRFVKNNIMCHFFVGTRNLIKIQDDIRSTCIYVKYV